MPIRIAMIAKTQAQKDPLKALFKEHGFTSSIYSHIRSFTDAAIGANGKTKREFHAVIVHINIAEQPSGARSHQEGNKIVHKIKSGQVKNIPKETPCILISHLNNTKPDAFLAADLETQIDQLPEVLDFLKQHFKKVVTPEKTSWELK